MPSLSSLEGQTTVINTSSREWNSRLSTPTPSLRGGKISFKLPPAQQVKGAQVMSSLTQQQNQRLWELRQREIRAQSGAAAATSQDDTGDAVALQAQRQAAVIAARKARDEDFYDLDVMLAQFACPSHVAPAPPKRDTKPGEVIDAPPVKTKAQQRSATERLYTGSGVGTKMPPRATTSRVPPAKLLEKRLNELRNDDAARNALHSTVQRHMRDIREENLKRCNSKDFLATNVRAVTRPASAPVKSTINPMDVRLDDRPPFRPGGAPEDLYERPGPQPYDYSGRSKQRPQSAMPGIRVSASYDLDDPVDAFRPARAPAEETTLTQQEGAEAPATASWALTGGGSAPPAAAPIV